MRKLWSIVAVVALVAAAGAPARAGTFDPSQSSLSFILSSLPPIVAPAGGGGTASFAGGVLTDTAGLFTGAGTVGTGLFTGVSLITNLTYQITNLSGTFSAGGSAATSNANLSVAGGGFGGPEPLTGFAHIAPFSINVPLNVVGNQTIQATSTTLFAQVISVQAAGFGTGPAQIKNITTNVTVGNGVQFTQLAAGAMPGSTVKGSYLNTVTISGGITRGGQPITLNQVSTGTSTNITLVAPLWVGTSGLSGNLPAVVLKQFHFMGDVVPEPGTVLLLGSGIAGLIAVGRRRARG